MEETDIERRLDALEAQAAKIEELVTEIEELVTEILRLVEAEPGSPPESVADRPA